MKIYIAGPITGLDYNKAFAAFERAERLLTDLGFDAVNPMKKVSEQQGLTWVQYMKEDIPLLVGCDAIYLLRGWGTSRGACLEHYIAHQLEMNVIYEPAENVVCTTKNAA